MKPNPLIPALVTLVFAPSSAVAVAFGSVPAPTSPITQSVVALVDAHGSLCSGVLIGNNTVLTAAHCVENMPTYPSPIVYFPQPGEEIGTNQKALMIRGRFLIPKQVYRTPERTARVPLGSNNGQDSSAALFQETQENLGPDLALLELDATALRSWNTFKRVPVLQNLEPLELNPGEGVKVAGFGIYELNDQEPSGRLHEGSMEVFGFGRTEVGTFLLQPSQVGGAKACSGDSGGGLFASRNGQWVLAGIISGVSGTPEQTAGVPQEAKSHQICRAGGYTAIVDLLQYGKFIAQAARWDTAIAAWVREAEHNKAPLLSNFEVDPHFVVQKTQQCASAFKEQQYASALGTCTTAAQHRVDFAQYLLGVMHFNGLGVHKSTEKAGYWMEKAAKQNYGPALFVLGQWHEDGSGPYPRNQQKAIEVYQKCARLGEEDCQSRLKALGIR